MAAAVVDTDAGSTWPEQDAVDDWVAAYNLILSHEQLLSLKKSVTAYRVKQQQGFEVKEYFLQQNIRSLKSCIGDLYRVVARLETARITSLEKELEVIADRADSFLQLAEESLGLTRKTPGEATAEMVDPKKQSSQAITFG